MRGLILVCVVLALVLVGVASAKAGTCPNCANGVCNMAMEDPATPAQPDHPGRPVAHGAAKAVGVVTATVGAIVAKPVKLVAKCLPRRRGRRSRG